MEQLTVKVFPAEVAAGVALPHVAVQFVPQEDTLLERKPVQVMGREIRGGNLAGERERSRPCTTTAASPLKHTDLQPAVTQILHMERP